MKLDIKNMVASGSPGDLAKFYKEYKDTPIDEETINLEDSEKTARHKSMEARYSLASKRLLERIDNWGRSLSFKEAMEICGVGSTETLHKIIVWARTRNIRIKIDQHGKTKYVAYDEIQEDCDDA